MSARGTASAVSALARSISRETTKLQAQSFTAAAAPATAKLPDLPYGYGELEPVISGEIMQLHHDKHHRGYVVNLNAAMGKLGEAEAKGDTSGIIAIQGALKFNGGGHINHSIFWKNLAPIKSGGGEPPKGDLAKLIDQQFGSLTKLQETMTASTVAIQGSGWGWLGYDKGSKRLAIVTLPNQDPLQATTGLVPLLGIDVWEHAYYLQYKNVRPDYVKNIWKIINWKDVAARFDDARKA